MALTVTLAEDAAALAGRACAAASSAAASSTTDVITDLFAAMAKSSRCRRIEFISRAGRSAVQPIPWHFRESAQEPQVTAQGSGAVK